MNADRMTPYRFQWLVYGARDLSTLDRALLARIALGIVSTPRDAGGWLTITAQALADDVGARRQSVSRALARLSAHGWLERRQPVIGGKYAAAQYRLPAHDWRPDRGPQSCTDRGPQSDEVRASKLQRVRSTQTARAGLPAERARKEDKHEEPADALDEPPAVENHADPADPATHGASAVRAEGADYWRQQQNARDARAAARAAEEAHRAEVLAALAREASTPHGPPDGAAEVRGRAHRARPG